MCAQKARLAFDNGGMKKDSPPETGPYQDFAQRLERAVARILDDPKRTYSIQDKATALGFSKSFMADLMKGRKMPSAPNIMDIATRTGVRAEWLWTGREPMIEKVLEGYLYIGDLNPDQQEAVKTIKRSYRK
jgi:hypothetical protein